MQSFIAEPDQTKIRIEESFRRYFKTLMSTGYMKHWSPDRLLVCVFLYDLIDSSNPLSMYVTENAYRAIDKLYRKMTGDCLMPYNVFCKQNPSYGTIEDVGDIRIRLTEDEIVRYSELLSEEYIRITAK